MHIFPSLVSLSAEFTPALSLSPPPPNMPLQFAQYFSPPKRSPSSSICTRTQSVHIHVTHSCQATSHHHGDASATPGWNIARLCLSLGYRKANTEMSLALRRSLGAGWEQSQSAGQVVPLTHVWVKRLKESFIFTIKPQSSEGERLHSPKTTRAGPPMLKPWLQSPWARYQTHPPNNLRWVGDTGCQGCTLALARTLL